MANIKENDIVTMGLIGLAGLLALNFINGLGKGAQSRVTYAYDGEEDYDSYDAEEDDSYAYQADDADDYAYAGEADDDVDVAYDAEEDDVYAYPAIDSPSAHGGGPIHFPGPGGHPGGFPGGAHFPRPGGFHPNFPRFDPRFRFPRFPNNFFRFPHFHNQFPQFFPQFFQNWDPDMNGIPGIQQPFFGGFQQPYPWWYRFPFLRNWFGRGRPFRFPGRPGFPGHGFPGGHPGGHPGGMGGGHDGHPGMPGGGGPPPHPAPGGTPGGSH